MKKLEQVSYFLVRNQEQFLAVFDAFAAPFPSLEKVEGAALYRWIACADEDAAEMVKRGLDSSSYGGRWPARIVRATSRDVWGRLLEEKVTITPYVGDCHLIVYPSATNEWRIFVADYTRRPSAYATNNVIALVKKSQGGDDILSVILASAEVEVEEEEEEGD